MKILRWTVPWLIAIAVLILRRCRRIRLHNDPRPGLQSRSQPYVYSVLHAHQIAALMDGEPGTGTMVSRSLDGDLLIPTLRVRNIIPIRGSSRGNGQDKGGRSALKSLIEHVRSGAPGLLAVDGPRGPRNRVSKGIALLSQKTGAAILNVVMVPNRRWILSRTWDRLQIPKPFAMIDAYFAEPVLPREGESMERYRQRIELSLNDLEAKHDWEEAQICRAVSPEPNKRAA